MVSIVRFVCWMAATSPSYSRKVSLGTFSKSADGAASVEEWGKRLLCVQCATLHDRSRPEPGKVLAAAALAAAPAEHALTEPAAPLAAGAQKSRPNTTQAGTRWTLRRRGKDTTMLRIDLGLQQVASLIVPPEWDAADPERFEAVVDRLRVVLLGRFPLQSALFMFWRDAIAVPDPGGRAVAARISPAPPAAPCG